MEDSMPVAPSVEAPPNPIDDAPSKAAAALTPPTSEEYDKRDERMSSELSELDSDDDEDIEPDHYFQGGKIPVFKPTMDQFRNFKRFVSKIDKYGMKSGIIKVIPPKEWRDSLPDLSEAVKSIKVKNPIMQEFAGQHGIYTQANIEKQRSYNLPEWRAVTDEPHHQPPAKRGERRKAAVEPPLRIRSTRTQPNSMSTDNGSATQRRSSGRSHRRRGTKKEQNDEEEEAESIDVPPTPTSPRRDESSSARRAKTEARDGAMSSKSHGRQPRLVDQKKSVSSRRLNNRGAVADWIDEVAFQDFDYHLPGLEEFTPERCKELEETYWKTINYGQPMYGADMPGSLFDDRTTCWNVAKLPNLLDVLGTKVPGVNTAYVYLGMWKATFAWHLEDVDLYSINYIHFGAPKQWYSISQEDARHFEAAMKSIWPNDAKNCSQFLRHKTYLVSPQRLEKDFNIKVNRLVHYEGEFVMTFPYGYHSGYNVGYNCAESVNFATEPWLSYGRIAKKCDCESDSVWVDVNEIERKLRGDPTPEYYEETDDEDEEGAEHLPSPPPSVAGKAKGKSSRRSTNNKRKRGKEDLKEALGPKKVKRIRIRIRVPGRGMPCILCPNDVDFDDLLPTDNGMKAHRICADYTPETFIAKRADVETVCNVKSIGKDRLELKCNYCRSKRGAVFQCSQKKCTRAFHATCAAAAGVQVDLGPMPTFDEEGTEYFYDGYDFRCRFHRPKKRNNKTVDADSLEKDKYIFAYAKQLKPKDVVQFQYIAGEMYQIHGAQVVENRPGEQSVLADVLPDGDRVEIEWKYLLKLHLSDSQRPTPSANAKALPEHLKESDASLDIANRTDGVPEMGDPFHDPNSEQKWAEWHTAPEVIRKTARVDLTKEDCIWYYLGQTSTEARAQYTEDPERPSYNSKSNFLDSVKPPPLPTPSFHRAGYSGHSNRPIHNPVVPRTPVQQPGQTSRPYQYKPKDASWKSPVYNPDTRKNPNSPVAHQPNVSYDHRNLALQYGQSPFQGLHVHRSPQLPQEQQYQHPALVPLGRTMSIDKGQTTVSPHELPNGIERHTHANTLGKSASLYAYDGRGNAQGSVPAYGSTELHSQGMLQSRSSIASLSDNSMEKSRFPDLDDRVALDWRPIPSIPVTSGLSTTATQKTIVSDGNSSYPRFLENLPTISPASRPSAQFQSPAAFQREMAKTSQSKEGLTKWEQMLKHLATSPGPMVAPSVSFSPSHPPTLHPPLDPRSRPEQELSKPVSSISSEMSLFPQSKQAPRPTPSPITDDEKDAKSTVSKAEPAAEYARSRPDQLHGEETWR